MLQHCGKQSSMQSQYLYPGADVICPRTQGILQADYCCYYHVIHTACDVGRIQDLLCECTTSMPVTATCFKACKVPQPISSGNAPLFPSRINHGRKVKGPHQQDLHWAAFAIRRGICRALRVGLAAAEGARRWPNLPLSLAQSVVCQHCCCCNLLQVFFLWEV